MLSSAKSKPWLTICSTSRTDNQEGVNGDQRIAYRNLEGVRQKFEKPSLASARLNDYKEDFPHSAGGLSQPASMCQD